MVVAYLTATAALYSNGNLTLFNGTTSVAQLTLSTPYLRNAFSVAADGSGGTLVTVSQTPPSPNPSDFNADSKSDILWQADGGAVSIWEMNGTSAIGGGSVGNPGPTWHAYASGDFNDDSFADILWQNNSGAVAIWELNGAAA